MTRAIIFKELRENLGIVALALLIQAWLLHEVMKGIHSQGTFLFTITVPRGIPFVGTEFTPYWLLITALLAIVLGFRQSVIEGVQGTYLFLLHRPEPRRAIFGTKLAVGVALVLLCGALPIVVYARWAATPGNVPAPFEWSMTYPTWQALLTLPLVYLGAFLSGLRPAHWFGTRLLPLVAGIIGAMCYYAPIWQWGLGALYLAAAGGLLVGAICFVARTRDYS